jgi:hypothetical protein
MREGRPIRKAAQPRAEYYREYAKRASPAERKRRNRRTRDRYMWRTYGLSIDQYEEALAAQGDGCAICGRGESQDGLSLSVDHDHTCCPGTKTCGRCIRGLLCRNCNWVLGQMQDDAERLAAAAEYLRSHPSMYPERRMDWYCPQETTERRGQATDPSTLQMMLFEFT